MTEAVLDRLRAAGLSQLHISLNGSTEEINALTRQGYGPTRWKSIFGP